MNDKVLQHEHDGILTLTINRPEVRNAFDGDTCEALAQCLDNARERRDIQVVVVIGAGDKAFSAGFDLAYAEKHPQVYRDPMFGSQVLRRPPGDKPIIAAVNGLALGMGFEFALACDLIVASDQARFGLPEVRVGLTAMGGGVARLARDIGQKRALEIALTGRMLNAEEIWRMGIVNVLATPSECLEKANQLAIEIAKGAPLSLAATKALAAASVDMDLPRALDPRNFPEVMTVLQSEDAQEGRRAFIEQRQPRWQGR